VESTITQEELGFLGDVVKEHLTDLRSEILETGDGQSRNELLHREEVLRVVLLKLERERQAIAQFLRT
jgi:hypothetical protein